MVIRTLVADDNASARRQILNLLSKHYFSSVEVVAEASSVESSIHALSTAPIQLAFLDMDLGDGMATDVIDAFEQPHFAVVMFTSHRDKAAETIRCNPLAYLIKPVGETEFVGTMRYVMANLHRTAISKRMYDNPPTIKKHFSTGVVTLATTEVKRTVRTDMIIRVHSEGRYAKVHLTDGSTMFIAKALGDFEREVQDYGIKRVHRTSLINIRHLRELVRQNNDVYAVMNDNEKILIADAVKDELDEIVSIFHELTWN
jgi:two-component system LytT family response regulator